MDIHRRVHDQATVEVADRAELSTVVLPDFGLDRVTDELGEFFGPVGARRQIFPFTVAVRVGEQQTATTTARSTTAAAVVVTATTASATAAVGVARERFVSS